MSLVDINRRVNGILDKKKWTEREAEIYTSLSNLVEKYRDKYREYQQWREEQPFKRDLIRYIKERNWLNECRYQSNLISLVSDSYIERDGCRTTVIFPCHSKSQKPVKLVINYQRNNFVVYYQKTTDKIRRALLYYGFKRPTDFSSGRVPDFDNLSEINPWARVDVKDLVHLATALAVFFDDTSEFRNVPINNTKAVTLEMLVDKLKLGND